VDASGLRLQIEGAGLRGAAPASVDAGNAGTLMRLLPGWLAGQRGGEWTIDGDASLRRRPLGRIVEPLRLMGADLEATDGDLAPLRLRGAALSGIEYELPVASAQVKSCLLFAGLLAAGETAVIEPEPSRDHSERMLAAAGAEIEIAEADGRRRVRICAAQRLQLPTLSVPGDLSSAAFAIVAALLVPGSELNVESVGLNPTRTGLLDAMARMGAKVEIEPGPEVAGEPTGHIRVQGSDLTATEIGGAEVPRAIDELPLLALAACFAEGRTTIRDAAELRHKESDRIAGVCDALRALGGCAEPTPDGMVIEGTGGLRGGAIDARGDHRLAMLGAVAGLASAEGVSVDGFDAAAVSYPGFSSDLEDLLG